MRAEPEVRARRGSAERCSVRTRARRNRDARLLAQRRSGLAAERVEELLLLLLEAFELALVKAVQALVDGGGRGRAGTRAMAMGGAPAVLLVLALVACGRLVFVFPTATPRRLRRPARLARAARCCRPGRGRPRRGRRARLLRDGRARRARRDRWRFWRRGGLGGGGGGGGGLGGRFGVADLVSLVAFFFAVAFLGLAGSSGVVTMSDGPKSCVRPLWSL
jgi:hypothetical protein